MPSADPKAGSGRNPDDAMHRPATIRLRTSLFEDAVTIVENEFASDLSLDDIARRVASSRRQLQRAYSEIGNTTFREHLTAVRMERAAELLRIRGLTVRDVAHRVGYRQPARSGAITASRRRTSGPPGASAGRTGRRPRRPKRSPDPRPRAT
jgi:AraC family transcriptional regulator of adaptative response / methylphosphotriester-DNA alkyltransferase methyltransferase